MSATIHGLTDISLIPGPDLFLARDADGLTTASREFTCLKSAVRGPYILSRIKKGTPITELCSDIPAEFSHLEVDSHSIRDEPGGFSKVSIEFKGYSEEGEFSFDRERNYSLRGTTFRRPILEHPTFISDMKAANAVIRDSFVSLLSEKAYAKGTGPSNYQVIRNQPNEEIVGTGGWINNATNVAWWDIIVKKGLRDYDAASLEWTLSTANAGGLSDTEIERLAKSDTPPGNPPTPDEPGWWQMMDLSDERSSNASSNSVTWRFVYGEKIPKLHDYEAT